MWRQRRSTSPQRLHMSVQIYMYNIYITVLDLQHIELVCSKPTLMFKNELNSLTDAIIQMQLSECHPMFQI